MINIDEIREAVSVVVVDMCNAYEHPFEKFVATDAASLPGMGGGRSGRVPARNRLPAPPCKDQ